MARTVSIVNEDGNVVATMEPKAKTVRGIRSEIARTSIAFGAFPKWKIRIEETIDPTA